MNDLNEPITDEMRARALAMALREIAQALDMPRQASSLKAWADEALLVAQRKPLDPEKYSLLFFIAQHAH